MLINPLLPIHIDNPPFNEEVSQFLARRLEQDADRDPVDALGDAEALQTLLESAHRLIADPATRYVLSARVREDLARGDLMAVLAECQHLVRFNAQRCVTRLPLMQEPANAR